MSISRDLRDDEWRAKGQIKSFGPTWRLCRKVGFDIPPCPRIIHQELNGQSETEGEEGGA